MMNKICKRMLSCQGRFLSREPAFILNMSQGYEVSKHELCYCKHHGDGQASKWANIKAQIFCPRFYNICIFL